MKIPIPRYEKDETLSWEERYSRLLSHYERETNYLRGKLDAAERLLRMVGWAQDMALDFVKNLGEEITRFLDASEEEESARSSEGERHPDTVEAEGSIPSERTD